MEPRSILVTTLREMRCHDITSELARRSDFDDVADLMAVAQHGPGEKLYLVEFEYQT